MAAPHRHEGAGRCSRGASLHGSLTLVWFDRLTSREDGVVERSRVSIQLPLKEQKPRLTLTLILT